MSENTTNKRPIQQFLMKTLNGMAYGFFATLIIGVIIDQLGGLLHISEVTGPIYAALSTAMGFGIGIGIALSLKLDGLKMVVVASMGAIATAFTVSYGSDPWIMWPPYGRPGNPLTVYLVVVFGYLIMNAILKKKTSFDILLVPLTGVLISGLLTFILSFPSDVLKIAISDFVAFSAVQQPVITSILVAVIMGMLLTAPISSAAIAILISLNGTAAAAALVGCTTQMIGFAVQSIKKNNIATILSVGLGTSMLQFKNIIKKPIIWLPTIIASAIISPTFYLLFNSVFTVVDPTETLKTGAGMGSSGLVGQLVFIGVYGYDSVMGWLFIAATIIVPLCLVWFIDLLFTKFNLYKAEDLIIEHKI